MNVRELIAQLSLYDLDDFVQIDQTGFDGYNEAAQVVKEAGNAVIIHSKANRLAVTYKSDGVTPRIEP